MVIHKNALMCIKKVKLINHDCLPILVLLYMMLVYLMLFAALSNAVCLCNALFFCYRFLQMLFVSCFVFVYFFNFLFLFSEACRFIDMRWKLHCIYKHEEDIYIA